MSEQQNDSDEEKTEQPSAKRLKEAREKGQVPRSKDFNAMMILLFSGVAFLTLGNHFVETFTDMLHSAFTFNADSFTLNSDMSSRLYAYMWAGVKAVVPILIIILLVSLIAPILLGGFVFSSSALAPKFSRLNPLAGFKRMVSVKGLFEMIKALIKFIIVGVMAFLLVRHEIPQLLALHYESLFQALQDGSQIVIRSFLLLSGSLLLIAGVDVPFQLYQHQKSLKMSKQELKEEYKETEGKPEVKGQIRKAQQEIARRRMMNEVPKAQVVITNPTHYSVAIAYQQTGKKAPYVVAKGRDLVAFQINKIAKANNIPQIQVPPLSRAIYYSTKLNHEIPRGLYVAVAQVLAYIFQLKDKTEYDQAPILLQNVPIPDDLKRDE